jgi:capsular polysaccharide export protein
LESAVLSLVTAPNEPHRLAPPSPRLVADNPALARLAHSSRVLLLQGPVGPFFDRLAQWLLGRGAQVHRVVFQAGDRLDCQALEPLVFRGTLEDWPGFLGRLMTSHGIDCVALFGQSRPHHVAALEASRRAGVPAVVLEEGYVRPGFATVELEGVNGHSTTLDRYRWCSGPGEDEPVWPSSDAPSGLAARMAWHAVRHYLALGLLPTLNPHYVHHRSDRLRPHVAHWVRTGWRWLRHHRDDTRAVAGLARERYFFFPLQNEGDAQITAHSPFSTVQQSVAKVLAYFARHAPADALLVVRQHPWSRGHRETERAVLLVAERLGVARRVVHLHEGDTAALVRQALGVVVVNSTVGLIALRQHRPLMVLGDAVYRRPGLCHMDELDSFWRGARAPEPALVQRFLRQLITLTQVPCDLYAPRHAPLNWGTRRQPGAVVL